MMQRRIWSVWTGSHVLLLLLAAACTPVEVPEEPGSPPAFAARYPTAPAEDIEQVLEQLEVIVELAKQRGDRIGYFAALYRQITREVWRGIQRGDFEDGPRMSRFDSSFANRYFAALEAWQSGGKPPDCWRQAFDLTRDDDTIILQHVLLGVSSHIVFDLAIAAAEVAPGAAIDQLKNDYDLINDMLVNVLGVLQDAMSDVSPSMALIDSISEVDESILGFSIYASRGEAWNDALAIARGSWLEQRKVQQSMDADATALGALISRPVPPLDDVVRKIRAGETRDVARVIERLNNAVP